MSDVLAQIPVSVTEDALRLQTYTGIAARDGQEMLPSKLLATFIKGNEVLVAVPEGVPSKECVRLARPILSDTKVVQMVSPYRCGVLFRLCLMFCPRYFVARLEWNRCVWLERRCSSEEEA